MPDGTAPTVPDLLLTVMAARVRNSAGECYGVPDDSRRQRSRGSRHCSNGAKESFRLLSRIEYIPVAQGQRRDNSPLAIAYENVVFRAEGLASDRLGEAERFFALTPHRAHHLCDCHKEREQ
jgi:hypothetical protein